MIIAAVDPGTHKAGFCALWGDRRSPYWRASYLKSSTFVLGSSQTPMKERLLLLHVKLRDMLGTISADTPKELVVEEAFVGPKISAALPIGSARGVVIVCAQLNGWEVEEMTASRARKFLLAKGNATKHVVQDVVKATLGLKRPLSYDESDAACLAIARARGLGFDIVPGGTRVA